MRSAAGSGIWMEFGLLAAFGSDVSHFVTTRHGGCSKGAYATMNCTHYVGDDPDDVSRNRRILCDALPVRPLCWAIPRQVHGTAVRILRQDFLQMPAAQRENALQGVDALVTDVPGCCLCVSTADCVPILLYDPCRRVVAAVHAGWRGTVQHIVQAALGEMVRTFHVRPADVRAGIGPSISLDAFEVGDEVREAFSKAGFCMPSVSRRDAATGKWHIDLWEAARLELLQCGLQASRVEVAGICTYRHYEQFFSARRLGAKSGRILSGIMLNP